MELNKICFVNFRFFMNYYTFINFQPINFTLKSISKYLQPKNVLKFVIVFVYCMDLYVELNKICL